MRIFSAVMLLAACGDDLRGPDKSLPSPDQNTPTGESPTPVRWLPQVCGVETWPGAISSDLSMSVVPTGNGAAIFGVPKAGGSVVGYAIDARGKMTSDGTKISGEQYTSLSASFVDGRYVVAAVSGTTTTLHLVSADFSEVQTIGKLDGNMLAATPIVTSRDRRIAATAGENGVTLATFDHGWNQLDAELLGPAPIGMDATTYGQDALVAWSTGSSCTVQELAVDKSATGLSACHSPRLAAGFGDRAELAYVGAAGVYAGDLYMSGHNAIAANHLVGADGTSPRIVFDGERYWMSYVNARGGITVGYLSEDKSSLISLGITEMQPHSDAYDLKLVDGQPWVFAADSNGYSAMQICLTHE